MGQSLYVLLLWPITHESPISCWCGYSIDSLSCGQVGYILSMDAVVFNYFEGATKMYLLMVIKSLILLAMHVYICRCAYSIVVCSYYQVLIPVNML